MEEITSRRQRILEAAAELFRDRGYAGTSMRDLAQAVDLQASSLYNHIKSKQDLLREICFNNAHRYLDGIRFVEANYEAPTERVEALIRLHIEIAMQDYTSITAFNDEWRHLDEPDLSGFRALRREYEQRFRQIIQQGMDTGVFKAHDPTVVLYTILSSVRWIHDWYRPGKVVDLATLEKSLCGIILNGLRTES